MEVSALEPNASPNLPLVSLQTTIRETMAVIDQCGRGIAVVVDEQRHLLATVTDGDIRRAILAGLDLNSPVMRLKQGEANLPTSNPVTAPEGTPDADILGLMQLHVIRQVPLLDPEGRVCQLAVMDDLLKETTLGVTGVIMAGGYGKRLMPLTESVPKPMLPVNGRPLLEHMLDKLRQAGIRSVNLATHHLSDTIFEHFKDGSGFGVNLNYIYESEPRGTAGALSRLPASTEPFLVMNGDILTSVDVRAMLNFHRDHKADLSVGVRQYDIEVPFGVVQTNGVNVRAITEKPVIRHFINAGIYMVNPSVCRLVPDDRRFDMTDLISALLESAGNVVCFPIREYWLDIGQIEQYQKAKQDVAEGVV